MTINKRAGRSIKKNIAFYIISIILTMLTSMVIVAAVSTGHTLTKVVDDFVKDYKAEDAEFVTYQPLSDADMEKLEQEYDVILEHSRYKDVNVESGDLKGATIRVFPMPEKLNLCEVRDGHEPGDGEALLTQDFADVHDIKVGDTISLGAYDYKVSAYTTKADYIYMLEKLSGYIDSEKFALVVVDRKEYDKIEADEASYYSIKYNKDNSKEVREEKKAVAKSLGEALKENRIRCQMTQEFVAETLGVSRQSVSKWENGSSDPNTSNLIALAKLYKISPEELLECATRTPEED